MGMIQDFQKADKERRSQVAEIQGEVSAIRGGVATMFKELTKESARRRSQLADIHREVAAMLNETDNMVKDLAKESAQRRSEVKDMLGAAVAAIHEEVWGKAPAKKKVVPQKATHMLGKLPGGLPAEEAVIEEAPAGELRDRVFAYLANHPDGARLTELEAEFSVARIQIARVIRALIDDNKVAKRDLSYFAI